MNTNFKKPLVSVIIVNYNGIGLLKVCLKSLVSQAYKQIEVILVDNASSDGSVDFVRKSYPQIKVVENKRNLGFANGNNIGFREARGNLILFLNNDTRVTKDFLNILVDNVLNDSKVGGVQSKIFLMDQKKVLDSVGTFLTNTGIMYHYGVHRKDAAKYSKKIAIHTAKGACMLFKREVLEKVAVNGEIFDRRYFAYFEESDLCHRVWMAGYEIYFIPESVIYHKMGATSSKLANSFVQFHSYKNRINSYLKNLSFLNLVKILGVHIFLCEVVSLYYLVTFNFGVFWAIQRAIVWNVLNLGGTMWRRKIIQARIRKVGDEEIFSRVMRRVGLNYYINLFSGLVDYED